MRYWRTTLISCSIFIVLDCVLYLSGHIDIWRFFGGILVVSLATPLTYVVWYLQIRYQTSDKMRLFNKIAFIGTGGFVAWIITFFGGAFIIWAVKGMPKPSDPPPEYLMQLLSFILNFIVPWIVGGYIGYRIGKRRDFRPYI